MAEVILYIASSLDGYIADRAGRVDWLEPFNQAGEDYGYSAFLDGVGTLLMGARTYRQVRGFGDWPYHGKRTIVFSHHEVGLDAPDGIEVHRGDPGPLLERLLGPSDMDIWLVGGCELIAQFVAIDAIDEYRIFLMPVILGSGIPLFTPGNPARDLQLEHVRSYVNGVVELRYGSDGKTGRQGGSAGSAG
jgi:dihydrofolate reductase